MESRLRPRLADERRFVAPYSQCIAVLYGSGLVPPSLGGSRCVPAGRVYCGVPAPCNLPVPPYQFVNDTTLRIGENPANSAWNFDSIKQL